MQWLLDPSHRSEMLEIAAAVTKQKPEALVYTYGPNDQFHAPDAKPDVAATQHAIDIENKYDLIHQTLTVAPNYVDLGPVEEAAKRLGGS